MNFIEEKIINKGNLDKLKLRFPPENNGYLHLGHAKSICLNFGLAEKYNRPCNLRFDDTNPSTEKSEYVDAILKDIEWLGFLPNEVKYTSDYFNYIYDCAIKLIKKGLAYVDDSTSEEIASMKGNLTTAGINSPFKSRSIEENLNLFLGMKNGDFIEGTKTLRANIDMSSDNMILRDPVIYRIINKEHYRSKNWNIYPMYDFAHPLSDFIEGITDSLCTLEFELHRPLYMWVLDKCVSGDFPEETEFSRLNVDYNIMSKRKIKTLVDNKIVDGWDDPRLLTLSGLRRRGYTANSIKNFCDRISVTRRESLISHLLLEECIREDLNKNSRRLMGVMDPIKLTVTNWDNGVEYVDIENNPEDESYGIRKVAFDGELWIERDDFKIEEDKKFFRLKIGSEVRLKGAYVIKAYDYIIENDRIVEILCTYDKYTKSGMSIDRRIKSTIHWVSRKYCVNFNVNDYNKLFTCEYPDREDDILSSINKDSLIVNKEAYFELEINNIKLGESIQIIRKGYYCMDKDTLNRTVSLKRE